MSTQLEIEYIGKNFEIEIDDDLDMVFLDYDIEYDEACLEFNYPKTAAIRLLETWNRNPDELIIRDFGLSRKQVILLATDWAEHVWPIFRKHFPGDRRVRTAIIATRKYVDSALSKQSLEAAWYETMKAVNDATASTVNAGAQYAAMSARDAAKAALDKDGWMLMAGSTSWYALHATGHEASTSRIQIDFPGTVAYEAEKAWQIRHAMKVVEYAQGKRSNWPSVEVAP